MTDQIEIEAREALKPITDDPKFSDWDFLIPAAYPGRTAKLHVLIIVKDESDIALVSNKASKLLGNLGVKLVVIAE